MSDLPLFTTILVGQEVQQMPRFIGTQKSFSGMSNFLSALSFFWQTKVFFTSYIF